MDRILLLEDDAGLIDGLRYSLEKNGFAPEVVRTVREAIKRLEEVHMIGSTRQEPQNREDAAFALLLLDVTLPDGTGFEVCERVRRAGSRVPILFLTAADEEVNIIRGLDCGGDDYLTKPFRLGELCSRIRALLRRSQMTQEAQAANPAGNSAPGSSVTGQSAAYLSGGSAYGPSDPGRAAPGLFLASGPLRIDPLAHKVWKDGQLLELTGAEYRLLYLLVENDGRVLTRGRILDELWDGNGSFVDDNTLSVYIRRLREKVEEDPSGPVYLQTVRGLGYQWKGKGTGENGLSI